MDLRERSHGEAAGQGVPTPDGRGVGELAADSAPRESGSPSDGDGAEFTVSRSSESEWEHDHPDGIDDRWDVRHDAYKDGYDH